MAFTLPAVASTRAAADDEDSDGRLALVIEDDADLTQVLEALLDGSRS